MNAEELKALNKRTNNFEYIITTQQFTIEACTDSRMMSFSHVFGQPRDYVAKTSLKAT